MKYYTSRSFTLFINSISFRNGKDVVLLDLPSGSLYHEAMTPKLTKHSNHKKINLHPRNLHQDGYDFDKLTLDCPPLKDFVFINQYGDFSIDFINPLAVKTLNKALMVSFYDIDWDIPAGYLCPPIPGRADYIHNLADLLAESNGGRIPGKIFNESKGRFSKGPEIIGLDVGVGASCIYPLLGHQIYGWNFVGSDIEASSLEAAKNIITANPGLKKSIICRLQKAPKQVFKGIIQSGDYFDFTLCNPPFHASEEDAARGSGRKARNLAGQSGAKLNFGGKDHELWCEGGELAFIKTMITESADFPTKCFWYTTLVSKKENLTAIYKSLRQFKACEIKTFNMGQGNKTSRMVAWTFLDAKQQKAWKDYRWKV